MSHDCRPPKPQLWPALRQAKNTDIRGWRKAQCWPPGHGPGLGPSPMGSRGGAHGGGRAPSPRLHSISAARGSCPPPPHLYPRVPAYLLPCSQPPASKVPYPGATWPSVQLRGRLLEEGVPRSSQHSLTPAWSTPALQPSPLCHSCTAQAASGTPALSRGRCCLLVSTLCPERLFPLGLQALKLPRRPSAAPRCPQAPSAAPAQV